MHVFICSFKVFQTNTVKCFETSLGLNSHIFSSLLSSLSWKALNQVSNLALTVLSFNSGPRKKFLIFLKPSGCFNLIIWLLIQTPEAEHGSPCLYSYRGHGGSPREISQASGWFSLTPVSMFTFWWGQRLATEPWHAMMSHGMWFVHTFLICLCTGGFMSGWYFSLSKRIPEASLLPNKHPFVSFYPWTS